jgi:hypothetical protein
MNHYDQKNTVDIETPIGRVTVIEKKWDEGEETEHWTATQPIDNMCFNGADNTETSTKFSSTTHVSAAKMVFNFFHEFAIAKELYERGYEYATWIDRTTILWIKGAHPEDL